MGNANFGIIHRRQQSESEDNTGHVEIEMRSKDLEDEKDKGHATTPKDRRSFDVHEMLRRGFGTVRRSLDVG